MRISLFLSFLAATAIVAPAKVTTYTLQSPDGKVSTTISAGGPELTFTADYAGHQVMAPSVIGLEIDGSKNVGPDASKVKVTRRTVNGKIASPFYRADSLVESYNALTIGIDKNWDVEFRAYNDGLAYRFVTKSRKPLKIKNEIAEYQFPAGALATVPYVRAGKFDTFEDQFFNSFENTYTTDSLSRLDSRRLSFLPLTVSPAGSDVTMLFTEAGLIDYPGMYLNASGNSMRGVFAPVPKTMKQGGHNNLQMLVTDRHDYIAEIKSPRALPWRILVVAPEDKTLAATDLTYLLAEPSKVVDVSWIKPGKVAWDWWNDWNIDGVDFETGVNNATYKAYIDFASEKGIEYVILDEGWAVNKQADLFQVVPEINLEELVAYADSKNVGLILWAGYKAFERDMEKVCKHYSDMGIKGFKVDFLDRDDQLMTDFEARMAEMCARYNMVLDIHGTHKGAGLNRTYPNVLNFEGVHGLEQMKWSPATVDQVEYDVMIPFIRQAAGPMDYTQGAMDNATKSNYYPRNNEPMSQGTRCRQLALYMILDSPLTMLCDTPSNYRREEECAEFIAEVPTTWDETVVLDGKVGDYIVTARRKGDVWYVGGITDWTQRDIDVDLSFLPAGTKYDAQMFVDGKNASRKARDYRKLSQKVDSSSPLKLHLAPGGGFALRLSPVK